MLWLHTFYLPSALSFPLPPLTPSACLNPPHQSTGEVTYRTDNFLSKNRDFVVAEHQALLGASTQAFVCALFPPADAADSAAGGRGGALSSYKFSSVGSRFKRQLGDLMEALHTMEPHYIRCIKPNSANRPMAFENMNVLHQVRPGGAGGGGLCRRLRDEGGCCLLSGGSMLLHRCHLCLSSPTWRLANLPFPNCRPSLPAL